MQEMRISKQKTMLMLKVVWGGGGGLNVGDLIKHNYSCFFLSQTPPTLCTILFTLTSASWVLAFHQVRNKTWTQRMCIFQKVSERTGSFTAFLTS
jgi:hypothetical protein